MFNFAYAWTCRSQAWPTALAAGLAAWLVSAFGLAHLPATPVASAFVALAAVCFGQSFLPRSAAVVAGAPLTRADLLGRMAAGAALTLGVTWISGRVGASWSGLLAVFPLLGTILCVSSQRAHGADFVGSLVRGMALGRFSFAAFCLGRAFSLAMQPAWAAFAEAAALAMLTQWLTKQFAMKKPAHIAQQSAVDAD